MVDIPFAFVIAGRQLDPTNPESHEQAQRMQQIVAAVSDQVDGLVCPEHKQPPHFLCSGESLEELGLEIHGCCEKLVEMATNCLSPQ